MTKENLIEFGFEEVSDEVGNVEKDWIDVVWDNFLEELFATKNIKFKELTKYCLRQQIEKHMSKQKKFTIKNVADYYMKIEEGLDKGVVEHNKENKIDVLITSAIVGFLRDHGQLE